jgi:hypothetical protein
MKKRIELEGAAFGYFLPGCCQKRLLFLLSDIAECVPRRLSHVLTGIADSFAGATDSLPQTLSCSTDSFSQSTHGGAQGIGHATDGLAQGIAEAAQEAG